MTILILSLLTFVVSVRSQCSFCQTDVVLAQNLLAYYSFSLPNRTQNNAGASNLIDVNKNMQYGTAYAVFTGGQTLQIPSLTLGGSPYSLCFWYYYNSGATNMGVFDLNGFEIVIDSQGRAAASFPGSTVFYPIGNSATGQWVFVCTGVVDSNWYHVNGTLQQFQSMQPRMQFTVPSGSIGGAFATFAAFQGSLDEVSFFSKFVTTAEYNTLRVFQLPGCNSMQPFFSFCGCPPGSIQTGSYLGLPCSQCPVGTFQNEAGQSTCVSCALGQFQSQPGATTCTQCSGGSFQNSSGSSACILCGQGTFQDNSASSACSQCPLNTVQQQQGGKTCSPCGNSFYTQTTGQTVCEPMPCDSCNGILITTTYPCFCVTLLMLLILLIALALLVIVITIYACCTAYEHVPTAELAEKLTFKTPLLNKRLRI